MSWFDDFLWSRHIKNIVEDFHEFFSIRYPFSSKHSFQPIYVSFMALPSYHTFWQVLLLVRKCVQRKPPSFPNRLSKVPGLFIDSSTLQPAVLRCISAIALKVTWRKHIHMHICIHTFTHTFIQASMDALLMLLSSVIFIILNLFTYKCGLGWAPPHNVGRRNRHTLFFCGNAKFYGRIQITTSYQSMRTKREIHKHVHEYIYRSFRLPN